MLPKYSKYEIQKMIKKRIDGPGKGKINELDDQLLSELLDKHSFWSSNHYIHAAKILETDVATLTEMQHQENLESVSFRAEENTKEINEVVEAVDDIFQALAYQLKLGDSS